MESANIPMIKITIIQAMTSSMRENCLANSRLAPMEVTPSTMTRRLTGHQAAPRERPSLAQARHIRGQRCRQDDVAVQTETARAHHFSEADE